MGNALKDFVNARTAGKALLVNRKVSVGTKKSQSKINKNSDGPESAQNKTWQLGSFISVVAIYDFLFILSYKQRPPHG